MLNLSKFTKINETFTCAYCGYVVPISANTCRDHCPQCLYSLHVDINPGDRAADCGGLLKPISYIKNKKKGFMINYKCMKCAKLRVNKFIEIDEIENDNFDVLISLQT